MTLDQTFLINIPWLHFYNYRDLPKISAKEIKTQIQFPHWNWILDHHFEIRKIGFREITKKRQECFFFAVITKNLNDIQLWVLIKQN